MSNQKKIVQNEMNSENKLSAKVEGETANERNHSEFFTVEQFSLF